MDWENDDEPPNLSTCLERAGVENTVVTHDAVDDARDVIRVIRASRKNSIVI